MTILLTNQIAIPLHFSPHRGTFGNNFNGVNPDSLNLRKLCVLNE